MNTRLPTGHAASPFDDYVLRTVGRTAPAVLSVFDQWLAAPASAGETFLDHLTARGVVDRVGARAVLMAWQGGFDGRDARQLIDRAAVERVARAVADTPPPAAALRAVGTRLGRYTVKGILGWGGFGPVYLAIHPTLRLPVAVKPLATATAADRQRVQAEARRQAAINHPNVVRVWDFEDGDEPLLVLEYVAGDNLHDRLADGPLAAAEAFTLVVHTGLALRAALRAGVTHRDVKPGNLLRTPEDGFKLGDFGLARCRRGLVRAVPADPPPPRAAAGTACYMAPEQFDDCADHRSDVYSLGLTLHHALTGRLPVTGRTPDEVMLRHKRGEVDPVHWAAPGVGRPVSDLVGRMTAVDPARRFDTYDELIQAAGAAFGLRLENY